MSISDSSRGDGLSSLDDSAAVELTGKIMVVAIIVLFVVVVFVLCLHLYAKYFWWSIEDANINNPPSSRRRRRRRFVFAPGQDPAVANLRRGLEPLVLRSLPVIQFDPKDFKDGLECAVCLSELVQGEKARLLPKCNHGFHVDCIDMWFQSHSTCPLCRDPVAAPQGSNSNSTNAEMVAEDVGVGVESQGENSVPGYSSESPNFPTNVLFWGNQTQVSSGNACLEEGPSSSSSVPSSGTTRPADGVLVIDIPRQMTENLSSSVSPSASRFVEEESKSPMTTRLRSLKRLLSRDRRSSPCSPGSVDVEQGGRGQS
ncbi:RING-H2 finger protein ATL3-like [Fagus crenata]|jgi:hypothetical protein|uniref:RING-type E3 ubiquitin transferase n=1 Tax=Fagus sylvatica TaxID=28930 RepID=A0A2N9G9C5_FAGSY